MGNYKNYINLEIYEASMCACVGYVCTQVVTDDKDVPIGPASEEDDTNAPTGDVPEDDHGIDWNNMFGGDETKMMKTLQSLLWCLRWRWHLPSLNVSLLQMVPRFKASLLNAPRLIAVCVIIYFHSTPPSSRRAPPPREEAWIYIYICIYIHI